MAGNIVDQYSTYDFLVGVIFLPDSSVVVEEDLIYAICVAIRHSGTKHQVLHTDNGRNPYYIVYHTVLLSTSRFRGFYYLGHLSRSTSCICTCIV